MTLSKWDVKIEKIPIIKVLTHCHTVTDYKTYNIKKTDILHRRITLAVGVRL